MAGETAKAAAEHGGAFPPFDASLFSHQLFWFAISFGLLYVLLATVILPRFEKTIVARKARLQADLDAAAAETAAAQAAREGAQAASAQSRAQARGTVEAVRRDVEAELAEADAKAAVEAESRLAEAEARISASRTAALGSLGDAVGELASDIVEQLTGKAPTAVALKSAIAKAGA
jgi:F-type H+-transporting ATPase subunit b